MIYINEWLPNPVGNDATGEFIELYNSSTAAVSLGGYALSDGAKKKLSLTGYSIPPGGYLVLKKSDSKLSLKNTDGSLILYGPDGRAVDQAAFVGGAPEDRSFSRADYGNAPINHFVFTYATPGEANRVVDTSVVVRDYPFGVSLVQHVGVGGFFLLMFGIATFFLVFLIYVTRRNRNISHLIFGRDEKIGI